LGQPSLDSNTERAPETAATDEDDWKAFDADVARLYPIEDPADIIMKVQIDTNDSFMEGSVYLR
jgi:hypothetical protein